MNPTERDAAARSLIALGIDPPLADAGEGPGEDEAAPWTEAETVACATSSARAEGIEGDLAEIPVGEQAGDRIGRYELVEPLGEGGFGTVWLARQIEPIRREVALKLIKPGMDSREIITRFSAERQALALMEHPHIAAVLDAGATETGRLYFVMERVEGLALTDHCDSRLLGIEERIGLFLLVCDAVQHAHRKGLIHRDLKPSNLLVAEVDGRAAPKVIDFGIAKVLLGESGGLAPGLTRTADGLIVGTPEYMSPEQAGSRRDIDVRSDVYSLGIVLYELLTGKTPLGSEAIRKADPDSVLRRIREEDVPRPSDRMQSSKVHESDSGGISFAEKAAARRGGNAARLSKRLQGELDWIVQKALEKERERRYQSVEAFAADLRRHLSGEAVAAGPPSTWYRMRKLVRRNRGALLAGAAVVVALIGGLSLTTWQAIRATTAERIAQSRLEMAEQARDAAERMLSESISDSRRAISAGRSGEIAESVAGARQFLERLPEGLVNRSTAGYRVYVGLGLVATAAFEGRIEETREQIESLIALVESLERIEPLGEQEEIDFNTALMVATFAMGEVEDFETSSRLRKIVRFRGETWLEAHPDALWALTSLSQEAASAALEASFMTRKPQNALGHIARLKLFELRLARKAPESVEYFQTRGLSLFCEAFASHHLERDPATVIDLFEDSAAALRLAYDTDDGNPYREVFIRDLRLGAETAAGTRLLDLGFMEADRKKLERGRNLIFDAFSERLELARSDPKRLEWWKDLAGSCKQMVKLADYSEDAAEAEKLLAVVAETFRLFPPGSFDHPRTAKILCEAMIDFLEWGTWRKHAWNAEREEILLRGFDAWRRSATAHPEFYNTHKDLRYLMRQLAPALDACDASGNGGGSGGSDLRRGMEALRANLSEAMEEQPGNPALACAHAILGLRLGGVKEKGAEAEWRFLQRLEEAITVARRLHRDEVEPAEFLTGLLEATADEVHLWMGLRPPGRVRELAESMRGPITAMARQFDDAAAGQANRLSAQMVAWGGWKLAANVEEWIDGEERDRARRHLVRLMEAAESCATGMDEELTIFNTILGPHWVEMDRWGMRLWTDGREEEALAAFGEIVRTRENQRRSLTPYHFATLSLNRVRCAFLLKNLGRIGECGATIRDARAALGSIRPGRPESARREALSLALDLLEASMTEIRGSKDGEAGELASLILKQSEIPLAGPVVVDRWLVDLGWSQYAQVRLAAFAPEEAKDLLRAWSEARSSLLKAKPSNSMLKGLPALPPSGENSDGE